MQLSELPKTMAEAKAVGSIYYFTGKACIRGHVCERYTKSKICNECKIAARKAWRAKNPERTRQLNRKNMKGNKRKISIAVWKKENREKLRQQERERWAKNPEKFRERSKNWKSKNVEICRAHCRNRKARLKNAEGTHTKSDIDILYAQQNGCCVACTVSLLSGYHVDHIVAISKGGKNSPDNLQLLCAPCNQSKSDKVFSEWLQQKVIAI